ncbi:CAP-Gly domain-containing linker protein 1-like [Ylistrum balloti]|uniref:CAP-Gly domain-containing linker protein 1-like n=1 Tax=Ylistrum balloti TaxID=509963 RepID=UPI002905ADF7|nr:CAP-Gly domain-containing linker protein 1-like [Ylistrum balloti]
MLRQGLNEVQQERTCLENKLHEQRAKRRGLEQELEKIKNKLSQVKDVHTKKAEISKVLHHKVGQIQALANSIEEDNQSRRKTINEKNNKIESLKEIQLEEIKSFEETLAALADKLVAARKFYDDNNLIKEISVIEERKQQMESQAGNFYQEMMALQSSFEELSLESQNKDNFNDSGIDLDTRKTIKSLFRDEQDRASCVLQRVKTDLQGDEEILDKL